MLGLPDGVTACLFDMDGVLTRTAVLHAAAWKQTFDEVLAQHGDDTPFDQHADYYTYVDGRTRADGVRAFLGSRHISLPDGSADDPPGTATVNAVGSKKNELMATIIHRDGVDPYEGSVRYLRAAEAAGLRRAVVSASANAAEVLESAGLTGYIEVRVDGTTVADLGLHGKPAPDTYLEAARRLGVEPAAAAVFEDALSGVEAGAAGHFGAVVGVDRVGQADALRSHGATVVVGDLDELLA